ncbi:inositol monophosphatase family protein [Sphingomicrobium clamense]|uniref:Histidinol phosphate phosphatase n=1 Tax=Sphingomicrobium clamense TaxID=2851013 RepID=A0ABS6V349_9SPHN|nr:inositol monophosphatase family protein [Sphingomicrobium sp. B8]MBW0143988.1 histidinol phosphate phosphatase [Sphingomicrobium sp. B8]
MDAAFFTELSDAARKAIEGAAREPENKAGGNDFDPVTEADRAAERAMRERIERRFPDHGIWGEEYGWTGQGSDSWWSLDPIDGTRAFVCGLPSWAVLVGFLSDGEHRAGMIDLPALSERVIAIDGRTQRNGETVRVSGVTVLNEARIATTDPGILSAREQQGFAKLYERSRVARYGLDAMAYARVATGDIDLVAETNLKPHDYDALVAVVRGAGGFVGNWSGGSDLTGGDVIAAASEQLYEEAVKLL